MFSLSPDLYFYVAAKKNLRNFRSEISYYKVIVEQINGSVINLPLESVSHEGGGYYLCAKPEKNITTHVAIATIFYPLYGYLFIMAWQRVSILLANFSVIFLPLALPKLNNRCFIVMILIFMLLRKSFDSLAEKITVYIFLNNLVRSTYYTSIYFVVSNFPQTDIIKLA